jgi:hypothetical protein
VAPERPYIVADGSQVARAFLTSPTGYLRPVRRSMSPWLSFFASRSSRSRSPISVNRAYTMPGRGHEFSHFSQ